MILRLSFEKTGSVKFISHLDLNRTLLKIFARANIPIAFSEGFNPHPRITYASSLPLGTESYAEFADVTLTCDADPVRVHEALNAQAPAGIRFKRVYVPERPLKQIAFAEYRIYCEMPLIAEDTFAGLFEGEVIVLRKTKSSEYEADISGCIKSVRLLPGNEDGYSVVLTVLTAGGDNYLNPDYIVALLRRVAPVGDRYIVKTAVYDAEMLPFK